MSNPQTKIEWLQAELAAVNAKLNEVEVARTQYLASYEISKARLEVGREKLQDLISDQQ